MEKFYKDRIKTERTKIEKLKEEKKNYNIKIEKDILSSERKILHYKSLIK